MKTTKTELKTWLKNELQCPQSFIDRLNKSHQIDDLKEQIENGDKDQENEVMDEIWQSYKDYCDVFHLDFEADNRNLKGIE